MSNPRATFPEAVWNGLSDNPFRRSIDDDVEPDFRDYDRVTAEMLAVQSYLKEAPVGGAGWRHGSGAPSDEVGVDGDYYLDATDGDLYRRAAGEYAIVANLGAAPVASSSAITAVDATTDEDTTILAANGSRKGASFYNDSTVVTWYIAFGDDAAEDAFSFALLPGDSRDDVIFTGRYSGVASAATGGVLRVTEFT